MPAEKGGLNDAYLIIGLEFENQIKKKRNDRAVLGDKRKNGAASVGRLVVDKYDGDLLRRLTLEKQIGCVGV